MIPAQEVVKKVSQAQGAWCEDCQMALGNQYWSLAQCLHLHRRGCPEHRIILWRFQ